MCSYNLRQWLEPQELARIGLICWLPRLNLYDIKKSFIFVLFKRFLGRGSLICKTGNKSTYLIELLWPVNNIYKALNNPPAYIKHIYIYTHTHTHTHNKQS